MSRARLAAALAAVTTAVLIAAVLLVIALPVERAGAHGPTGTLGVETTPGSAPPLTPVGSLNVAMASLSDPTEVVTCGRDHPEHRPIVRDALEGVTAAIFEPQSRAEHE